MAVTKLKLMNISGGLGEFEPVLYLCATDPQLHLEDAPSAMRGFSGAAMSGGENPYRELMSNLESLALSAGLELPSVCASPPAEFAFDLNEAKQAILAQAQKLKEKKDEIASYEVSINENQKILEQLDHVGDISADLDALFGFEFFKFRFGHMPREAYDSIALYGAADMDDAFFIPSSIEKNEVWGIYFTPRTKSAKVDSMFSILHFERVRISDKVHGTPECAKTELTKEVEAAKGKIVGLKDEQAKLIGEAGELVGRYQEKIRLCSIIYEQKKKAVCTRSEFGLIAWLPEAHVKKFTKQLEAFETVSAHVNSPSEMPYISPPTLLKNFFLFRPFEQFVKMYGLPQYNEIDPTPFLALTYMLFFGIMFADLGQGLIISVAGFLLWRLKRINLGRIAGVLGLSSAVFGCIFGSVFGFENVILGYNPLEHINTVLIAAIALGVFTVSGAIILNIINGIKQKNIEKTLFSQNGIAGLAFYWAVVAAVLAMVNFLPVGISVAALAVIAAVCAALVYLKEPLSNLITKKAKLIPQNPAEFFVTGLFELFELALSFLTNTVSFIRVGAFALNHVGMMSVVLLLSGSASKSQNPAVIILGNIVVIALEGLIVGIQCLRLQYYEIFGKFYGGSGREFATSEKLQKK